MYLEDWNSGYWLSEFHVESVKDESPSINRQTYQSLQYEIHPTGEPDDVMVKIEERHYEVAPADSTPIGVLELPRDEIEELRIRNPPERRPVLVVKPWFQDYLSWSETCESSLS